MPLYEYKCPECGHQFEKLESFSADRTTECQKCGSKAKRVLSLGSFILKGSGWYATDHPSKSKPKSTSAEKVACDSKCDTCCASAQKSA